MSKREFECNLRRNGARRNGARFPCLTAGADYLLTASGCLAATGKNSFLISAIQRVLRFLSESYFLKAIENFFPVFA